ncbi:twin-arginine translocase TatA/TatE family subunit [candidate division KSB1 bacterium]|nr:twin-arginine translocase TatA/TatE family subunit [candidate division KSB1 bacterium]
MLGMSSPAELLVVLFVILLLFGAKKLPELARGLGKGISEFKSATRGEEPPKVTKKSDQQDKGE